MDQTDLVKNQPEAIVLPPKEQKEDDEMVVMRGRLIERVKPDFDEIVEGQINLAKGVWVKEYVRDKKTGKMVMDPLTNKPVTNVYLKPPDREAGKYLLDQTVGKPKETQVLEGKVNFILD